MDVARGANLAVMFLLELAAYAGAGYWGFTLDEHLVVRVLGGLGTPVLLGIVWWWLGAPNAPRPVRGLARVILEVLWFGLAFALLAASGLPVVAGLLGAVLVVNIVLRAVWRQSPLRADRST